jgi:NAD(P)-dependent dehydrogenase (short-subunit alcohol dehydrogenase family)
MSAPLANRTVIITGAGKGLGRAYALHLAALGANIVVNNRRHAGEAESSAERVVREITALGGAAVAEHSSVEQPGCGAAMLRVALENFGRLDAVVANAAIAEGGSFHKQDLADFRRLVDVNLLGTVNAIHPGFQHLYAQGRGAIVVSTSVAGLHGEHGLPAYSASKAALIGLMRALSREGAPHGVRVNALAPFAATQMTAADLPPALSARLGPERVAPVVAWLVSDACTLSGEILIVGGGRMARARVAETAPADLPPAEAAAHGVPAASWQALWEELRQRPFDRYFDGAQEQFRQFVRDI